MTSGGVRIAGKDKKLGRPKTMTAMNINVKVSKEVRSAIDRLAKKWDCTKSSAIRRAILEAGR